MLLVRVDPAWSCFLFQSVYFSFQLIRPPVGLVMVIYFLVGLVESKSESESESDSWVYRLFIGLLFSFREDDVVDEKWVSLYESFGEDYGSPSLGRGQQRGVKPSGGIRPLSTPTHPSAVIFLVRSSSSTAFLSSFRPVPHQFGIRASLDRSFDPIRPRHHLLPRAILIAAPPPSSTSSSPPPRRPRHHQRPP